MASFKEGMRDRIAESMKGRGVAVHGETPAEARAPSSIERRSEGRKRLDEACVIRLDRIVGDPDQPRKEFDPDALARLAESLKARGQLQPIRVRWDDALDRYVVVVGERRWRAARLAGLETIACVVVTGPASAEDLLEDQLVENALREDLRPVEQARAFRAILASRQLTQRQLAERLQIGHASVARALALLDLPESIQSVVEAGEIAPNTAYELSKVEDPGEQAALAKEAAEGRLRRDVLKERTRTPRQGRGAPKVWAHTAGRVKVTLSPLAEDVTDEELTEALRSALSARRKKDRGQAA
jgi:ParB family chromosome partitioning protein